jgi:hypothetical protein
MAKIVCKSMTFPKTRLTFISILLFAGAGPRKSAPLKKLFFQKLYYISYFVDQNYCNFQVENILISALVLFEGSVIREIYNLFFFFMLINQVDIE